MKSRIWLYLIAIAGIGLMAAPTAISLIAEKNTDINNFADNLQPATIQENNSIQNPQDSQENSVQTKKPGFETILAISGLLAVAYLVYRQKK